MLSAYAKKRRARGIRSPFVRCNRFRVRRHKEGASGQRGWCLLVARPLDVLPRRRHGVPRTVLRRCKEQEIHAALEQGPKRISPPNNLPRRSSSVP